MLTIVKHSLLHNYFKFLHAFYFNLFKQSLISRSKNYITNHHVSGSCLTQLYNISLSQQVHLHSLLDLICPSVSKIFQSIFKLLDRICWLTRIPSVKKFSPWSDYLEYKRKVLWTTTKLKDKAIWNAEVVCQFAYMYNYKHLLTANQKQDILNALQTGGGSLTIRPSSVQLGGGFLGSLLTSNSCWLGQQPFPPPQPKRDGGAAPRIGMYQPPLFIGTSQKHPEE